MKANKGDERLAKPREDDRTEESPGHGAGKGEVVVGAGEAVVDIGGWCAIDKDVVSGLKVE